MNMEALSSQKKRQLMTTIKHRIYRSIFIPALILGMILGCSRDVDELEPASYPTTAEVFIDDFSAGLNYAAFGGSKTTAFQVDIEQKYQGSAAMRFDVPDAGDPEGGFAAGIFFSNVERDLSGYDALTFWAKATGSASISEIGLGFTFEEEKYRTFIRGLSVGTSWKKYIIPLPDPSKLTLERGLFYYVDEPDAGKGYSFWVDEVKFEKLGTIAHPRPAILEGQDQVIATETGDKIGIGGIYSVFNLPNGVDQRVEVAPSYFTFISSATSVAMVDALGTVSVIDSGQTVIKAQLNGLDALGSLTINSTGEAVKPAEPAPTPLVPADSVISLFSNAYPNVRVDTWNPFWQFSTAQVSDIKVGQDDVKRYKNLNFVGILFESEQIDASAMTHFHLDLWTPDPTDPPAAFKVLLVDFGADGNFGGGDDTSHELSFTRPTLATESWVSLDIPLSDFVGLTNRGHLAQLVLSGDLSNVFIDNVYFYRRDNTGGPLEPTEAAPNPTRDAAGVISLFSDAYTDVAVDTWRTDWSSAVLEDVTIAGDAAKKYSALDFVGIETVSNTIDATAMTHFHLDVWSANFTFFGIKLVDFGADGAFGGGDDVEHQVNFETPTQGGWISYDIPLSDFAGLTARGHLAQYILVGRPSGAATAYVDNVYLYKEGGGSATEPTVAAPAPSQDQSDVIAIFSDAYPNVPGSDLNPNWGQATTVSQLAIDANNTLLYSGLNYQGLQLGSSQDVSTMDYLHIDYWTANSTGLNVFLISTGPVETAKALEVPSSGWASVDIPLTDFAPVNLSDIIQFKFDGNGDIYLDNIYFYREKSEATEPPQAAPAPSHDAADVISLFSEAYTNVSVDTWRTDWSSVVLEDVSIAGNATKKYSNLDFVGIETVSNSIDATGMTHFHLDAWSADFTFFGIKLVDFGADGAFGGGDDVEHQINFPMPAQKGWISYDIPLSDFTGLSTRAHLAQYILVGQPSAATTVYIDNVYFHK